MMAVVSDTGPLNYLILIGEVDVLPRLYGRVLIPAAVEYELLHPQTPPAVRAWMMQRPPWLEVVAVREADISGLEVLGPGERETILLAKQVSAFVGLIDDAEARRIAERHALRVMGTLGVLRDASRHKLLDLYEAIQSLRGTTFRISEHILEEVLRSAELDKS